MGINISMFLINYLTNTFITIIKRRKKKQQVHMLHLFDKMSASIVETFFFFFNSYILRNNE